MRTRTKATTLTLPLLLLTSWTLGAQGAAPVTPDRARDLGGTILGGIIALTDWFLPTLAALAAVGTLTMVLQQVVKDVRRRQATFNRDQVSQWAARRHFAQAHARLIALASGGNTQAMFSLDGAGVVAQLTAAAKLALAFPDRHHEVLRLVVGPDGFEDVDTIKTVTDAEMRALDAPVVAAKAMTDNAMIEQQADRAKADLARTRLAFLIERSMDSLQILLTFEWERWNRHTAFLLSVVITVASALFYFWKGGPLLTASEIGRAWWTVLAGGLLAGFLAPVAKDLVGAIQGLRGGR